MNPLMFPFSIHSDATARKLLPIVTPNNGNTFGWQRDFQVTTSLQNRYSGKHQLAKRNPRQSMETHACDHLKVAR